MMWFSPKITQGLWQGDNTCPDTGCQCTEFPCTMRLDLNYGVWENLRKQSYYMLSGRWRH